MADFKHDPLRELTEIRNQLSYSKRIGFLFGAGTSKAMGISDISGLTRQVEEKLNATLKPKFEIIKGQLDKENHIEAILNQVRLVRKITSDSNKKSFTNVSGDDAKKLDKAICNQIYKIISEEEKSAKIQTARKFISWLNWLSRDYPKEIFTTNYDLIIEKSLEYHLIPFFDGFVGSHEPFFAHETLDATSNYDKPPSSWIRLWKLHGSLGWFWKSVENGKADRVIRLGAGAKKKFPDSELVIYPSKDKYESSRKQPFTSYFDRLKDFLLAGEGIFIISGYSFSDDHVNEVLFSALNQNSRLHIIAFFFKDTPLEKIVENGKNLPNFTMLSPSKASISGIIGEWSKNLDGDILDPFWHEDSKILTLGDFTKMVDFLILCSGMKDKKD
ncbi:MAG: SIR2 family protein [Bacteroidota bacterium]